MIYNPVGSQQASRQAVRVGWVALAELLWRVRERQRLFCLPHSYTHTHAHARTHTHMHEPTPSHAAPPVWALERVQ